MSKEIDYNPPPDGLPSRHTVWPNSPTLAAGPMTGADAFLAAGGIRLTDEQAAAFDRVWHDARLAGLLHYGGY